MASTSQCVGQPCQPVRDEGGVDFSKKPSENKFLLTLAAPVSLPPAVSGLDQRREKIGSANSHLPISLPQIHKSLHNKWWLLVNFFVEKMAPLAA